VRTWGGCGNEGLGTRGERDSGEVVEGLTKNGRAPVGTGVTAETQHQLGRLVECTGERDVPVQGARPA
jgi:hypothetical protein